MQGYGVDASSVSVASVVIAPPRAETRGDADALSLADLYRLYAGRSGMFGFVPFLFFPPVSARVSSFPDEKTELPLVESICPRSSQTRNANSELVVGVVLHA